MCAEDLKYFSSIFWIFFPIFGHNLSSCDKRYFGYMSEWKVWEQKTVLEGWSKLCFFELERKNFGRCSQNSVLSVHRNIARWNSSFWNLLKLWVLWVSEQSFQATVVELAFFVSSGKFWAGNKLGFVWGQVFRLVFRRLIPTCPWKQFDQKRVMDKFSNSIVFPYIERNIFCWSAQKSPYESQGQNFERKRFWIFFLKFHKIGNPLTFVVKTALYMSRRHFWRKQFSKKSETSVFFGVWAVNVLLQS